MDRVITRVRVIKAYERNVDGEGTVTTLSDPTVIAGRVVEVEPCDPHPVMTPEDLMALCMEELEGRR